ncbi:MAG TPA: hypothetical protein VMH81_11025 [Bryobacteraceae bacterium]|nr:hypothetical protein [Bryobacteraceae bacterium]
MIARAPAIRAFYASVVNARGESGLRPAAGLPSGAPRGSAAAARKG